MQQYKEFKKRAKQAKKSIQQALDEDENASLQSLVELLEQFKVTDPTPEEKRERDEQLYMVLAKKSVFLVAFISLCLGLSVMQLFADFVQADTTHVGRTGRYVPTKLATHTKESLVFGNIKM